MPKLYEVKINRLPLPLGPLSEGHPERTLTISAKPDVHSSEADVLQRARVLVQQGYGISIKEHPDGREWSHAEILRRLNGEAS
jgi:hypothetical protein